MNMPSLGAPELLIILVIVLMLFGIGRLGKMGGELGSGIRAFRDGLKSPEESIEPKPAEINEFRSGPDAQLEETPPDSQAESQDNVENK
jgi:sec-independent protein translocase protein TatA